MIFNQAVLESLIRFSITAWFANLSLQLKNKLSQLIHTAWKIIGVKEHLSHVLHTEYELLPSIRRFRVPRGRLNHLKNIFNLFVYQTFKQQQIKARTGLVDEDDLRFCTGIIAYDVEADSLFIIVMFHYMHCVTPCCVLHTIRVIFCLFVVLYSYYVVYVGSWVKHG